MTRALVLGGGGPVGIGWEAGLLVSLIENGVDVTRADAVVGTSAGSVVGFTLASGGDLADAANLVSSGPTGATPAATESAGQIENLMAALSEAATDPDRADEVRAGLGQLAEAAQTMSEQDWLEFFARFAGADWPDGFACTAVNTKDGTFRVWDQAAGVDPQLAIASSCAVPCVFPPVTIDGARWMDGGVRDVLNPDVAAGHDQVLAVSCMVMEMPPGFTDPVFDAVLGATRSQIDSLTAGGSKVATVVPGQEMLDISGWGANLMDFTRTGAAYEAGLRQGKVESARLAEFWG